MVERKRIIWEIGGGMNVKKSRSNDVFFFKQKTAYEIGTGDWSSDVCSSDLFYSSKQALWYLNQPDRTSGSGFFTQIGVKRA